MGLVSEEDFEEVFVVEFNVLVNWLAQILSRHRSNDLMLGAVFLVVGCSMDPQF